MHENSQSSPGCLQIGAVCSDLICLSHKHTQTSLYSAPQTHTQTSLYSAPHTNVPALCPSHKHTRVSLHSAPQKNTHRFPCTVPSHKLLCTLPLTDFPVLCPSHRLPCTVPIMCYWLRFPTNWCTTMTMHRWCTTMKINLNQCRTTASTHLYALLGGGDRQLGPLHESCPNTLSH